MSLFSERDFAPGEARNESGRGLTGFVFVAFLIRNS